MQRYMAHLVELGPVSEYQQQDCATHACKLSIYTLSNACNILLPMQANSFVIEVKAFPAQANCLLKGNVPCMAKTEDDQISLSKCPLFEKTKLHITLLGVLGFLIFFFLLHLPLDGMLSQ